MLKLNSIKETFNQFCSRTALFVGAFVSIYFASPYVKMQPTLRADGTDQTVSKAQFTEPSLYMISSAMIEHI